MSIWLAVSVPLSLVAVALIMVGMVTRRVVAPGDVAIEAPQRIASGQVVGAAVAGAGLASLVMAVIVAMFFVALLAVAFDDGTATFDESGAERGFDAFTGYDGVDDYGDGVADTYCGRAGDC